MSARQRVTIGLVESPRVGLEQARALFTKGRKGPPSEYDRPPVSPAPGPKRKPLPGQLDLDGREVPGLPELDAPDPEDGP